MTKKYKRIQQKSIYDLTVAEIAYGIACECIIKGLDYELIKNKLGLGDFAARLYYNDVLQDMTDEGLFSPVQPQTRKEGVFIL